MKANLFNERSRVNRDNFMLILLISSAAVSRLKAQRALLLRFLPKRARERQCVIKRGVR